MGLFPGLAESKTSLMISSPDTSDLVALERLSSFFGFSFSPGVGYRWFLGRDFKDPVLEPFQ